MRVSGLKNPYAMRSYHVEGIVIKRSNSGEADRFITLFTKEKGKLTLKAKGVRRITSRRAGSLELFNVVRVAVVQGKGDVDVITELTVVDTFSEWRKFLGRVTLAYQLAEILDKLTAEWEPHPEVYAIMENSLSQLGSLGNEWKNTFDSWLVEIIRRLGYWPEDKPFTGDVQKYIETLSERPIHSRKFLDKLR